MPGLIFNGGSEGVPGNLSSNADADDGGHYGSNGGHGDDDSDNNSWGGLGEEPDWPT